MSNKIERRLVNTECRAIKEDGKPTRITGYAAVFNSDSEDMGFIEQIAPGAFDVVLASDPDTRCLWNHDPSALLGRTRSKTLSLSTDETGLRYDCIAPDTNLGRDILVLTDRGDISQSSFGFVVDTAPGSERWFDAAGKETNKWGGVRRVIYRIKQLVDVSPVSFAAYSDSSAEARSKFYFPEGKPMAEQRQDSKPSLALNGVGGDKADCYEDQINELQDALNTKLSPGADCYYYGGQYWICETYTDSVIVYAYATDKYFQISYKEPSNDVFEFGELQPVEEAWVASERSKAFVAERRTLATADAEKRTAAKTAKHEAQRKVASVRLSMRRK